MKVDTSSVNSVTLEKTNVRNQQPANSAPGPSIEFTGDPPNRAIAHQEPSSNDHPFSIWVDLTMSRMEEENGLTTST